MTSRLTFIKFLLVGCINTVIGLSSIFIFLHVFHFRYWLSTFLGNSIGAICSYLLNRHFTFRSEAPVMSSLFRFVIVILSCYFLSYKIGLMVGEKVFANFDFLRKYDQDIAVLIGAGLYTITNYFGQKLFVFQPFQHKLRKRGSYE